MISNPTAMLLLPHVASGSGLGRVFSWATLPHCQEARSAQSAGNQCIRASPDKLVAVIRFYRLSQSSNQVTNLEMLRMKSRPRQLPKNC